MFQKLMAVSNKLAGGSAPTGKGGYPRISIKGGKFRKIVNGEQVYVSRDNEMNIVIVSSSDIGRTFYEGQYNPENPAPPKCWSRDSKRPAEDVPEDQRMCTNCADCPMNVKGSGNGNARACRFGMQLAVAIEGELGSIYKLALPATSIFGSAEGGRMPMQAYGKYLAANNTPSPAIVTQMYFDENSEVPKLFFKAVRPLEDEELNTILPLVDAPETKAAITMTVAQADGLQPKKLEASAPITPESEEVEEPKKVKAKTTAPEPKENASSDLTAVIGEWDDE